MIQATSTFVSDNTGIRLQFSTDLARLWNWFLTKETGMIFKLPLRSAKIGLYRANSYHKNKPDYEVAKECNGQKFEILLDPQNLRYVYSRKGYWVCFLNVFDPTVDQLLIDLGLTNNFWADNHPHMSISNGKYFKNERNNKS